MKILVVGHAQHGKDTVAEMLSIKLGLPLASATRLALPYVRQMLESVYGITYVNDEECYEDRINHRAAWKLIIAEFNEENLCALADLVYAKSDIYVGVRRLDEYLAIIAKYSPLVVWVDASSVVEQEAETSMELTIDNVKPSYLIFNNHLRTDTGLVLLEDTVDRFIEQAGLATNKWHARMFKLAKEVASWSKDPEAKVGAVITDSRNRVISVGYNGFPYSVHDSYASLKNKAFKLANMLHAEQNAIESGSNSHNSMDILYTTKIPCLACAEAIVATRITKVVCPKLDHASSWAESQVQALALFENHGVQVHFFGDSND